MSTQRPATGVLWIAAALLAASCAVALWYAMRTPPQPTSETVASPVDAPTSPLEELARQAAQTDTVAIDPDHRIAITLEPMTNTAYCVTLARPTPSMIRLGREDSRFIGVTCVEATSTEATFLFRDSTAPIYAYTVAIDTKADRTSIASVGATQVRAWMESDRWPAEWPREIDDIDS